MKVKDCIIEKRTAGSSSPKRRAEARKRHDALMTRKKEVEAEMEPLKGWAERLLNTARFVVDVAAGQPSLSQLEFAVQQAEKYRELVGLLGDIRRALPEVRGEMCYYQWHAGQPMGGNGLPALFQVQVAEADTRKELDEKIKAAKAR